ncbi:MAG: hypothetical protein HY680_09325 [Chloroflexi bacterium]|nr:hypothetical protein [Chloroflexota bacterium]
MDIPVQMLIALGLLGLIMVGYMVVVFVPDLVGIIRRVEFRLPVDLRPAPTQRLVPLPWPPIQPRILTDVAPGYLHDFYKQYTGLQADALVKPYLGKWMTVGGAITTINFVKAKGVNWYQVSLLKVGDIYFFFDEPWGERLSIKNKGDQVTVIGQVESVDRLGVTLHHCELA